MKAGRKEKLVCPQQRPEGDVEIENHLTASAGRPVTLECLPAELRQQIWRLLLDFEAISSSFAPRNRAITKRGHLLWRAWLGRSVFDLHHYRLYYTQGFSGHIERRIVLKTLESLRKTSSRVRFEVEAVFLSEHCFSFNDPQRLVQFCNTLPAMHQNILKRVGIHPICKLKGPNSLEDWSRAVLSLPSSVRRVDVRLGAYLSRPWSQCTALYGLVEAIMIAAPKSVVSFKMDERPLLAEEEKMLEMVLDAVEHNVRRNGKEFA